MDTTNTETEATYRHRQAMTTMIRSVGNSVASPVVIGVGKLEVFGTGIKANDLSEEAWCSISHCDVVLYCVADVITEIAILQARPDAVDLTVLYGYDQLRRNTYVQMAEVALGLVRAGRNVTMLLYGHPGFLAMPSHRAIRIARREGYNARMVPGISALDYMVADLSFDPGLPGMLTTEATSLVNSVSYLDGSLHSVIWQVGLVGDYGFSRHGFKNGGFGSLLRIISNAYGADWRICHYIGSQIPGYSHYSKYVTVSDLFDKEMTYKIHPMSSFYIPPRYSNSQPELFRISTRHSPTPLTYANSEERGFSSYNEQEIMAIARLANFSIPVEYKRKTITPLRAFFAYVARNPIVMRNYSTNRDIDDNPYAADLNERERNAVMGRNLREIMLLIRQ